MKITHLFSTCDFFSQPVIATLISIKWIEPLCMSDSSGMHYPLDNTYLTKQQPQWLSISHRGNKTTTLTIPTDKKAAFFSRQHVKGILPLAHEFARNQSRDIPPLQACTLKSRGRFNDEGKNQAILQPFSSWKEGRVITDCLSLLFFFMGQHLTSNM